MLLLASDEASFVTGADLVIDGGFLDQYAEAGGIRRHAAKIGAHALCQDGHRPEFIRADRKPDAIFPCHSPVRARLETYKYLT